MVSFAMQPRRFCYVFDVRWRGVLKFIKYLYLSYMGHNGAERLCVHGDCGLASAFTARRVQIIFLILDRTKRTQVFSAVERAGCSSDLPCVDVSADKCQARARGTGQTSAPPRRAALQ